MQSKFKACAGRVLGAGHVTRLYGVVSGFDRLPDIKSFTTLLKLPPTPARAAKALLEN